MSQEQFNLLKPLNPGHSSPLSSDKIIILKNWTSLELHSYLKSFVRSPQTPIALDVETKGTRAHCTEDEVVGIGLADSEHSVYFQIANRDKFLQFSKALEEIQLPLIAHNLIFDASWFIRDSINLNWVGCTYAWYRLLANEGWAGQRWGLKDAMIDLLGWEETNESGIDNWLIDNNYINQSKKPLKEEMWRVPPEILGSYCAQDAYATYVLWESVLSKILNGEDFGEFYSEYNKWLLCLIKKTIEQQLRGIQINVDKVYKYKEELKTQILDSEKEILYNETISPFIREYNQQKINEFKLKEPAKIKKDGDISKNWLKWKEKLDTIELQQHFNLNSSAQKQWLFYDKLKFPVIRETENGQSAVDSKALLQFGEVGQLFVRYNELVKELGYVEKCYELVKDSGVLHPQLRVPGTLTGRCSGSGGLNIQQLPKSRQYLEAWISRNNMKWVDFDFHAIEPVVLTELSKDPSMLKIYGPNAGPNDIYLMTGAVLPGLKDNILAAGYDPRNPTKEGIANAKKLANKERAVSKVVVLGSNYGMGAKKLMDDLSLHGFPVTFEQAKQINRSYWNLYKGIKEFESYLLTQLEKTGGWVLNGIGRPICIASGYEKDIVNRVVQSTAHDILMYFIYLLYDNLNFRNIQAYPLIVDFHDQTIIECDAKDSESIVDVINITIRELNEKLGGSILLKGNPNIVSNLAEAKIED